MFINEVKKYIDKHEVISFDIFDTLLLRPYVCPTDMFRHLEKIYEAKGFAQSRINAEMDFYSKFGKEQEATLDDIYKMLPEFSQMKEKEIDWEKQILSVNSEVKEVYDYALKQGKKVIICSDMYLPIATIEEILNKNGIKGYDKLYLSNHLNLRKDRGDMYDYIISDLNVLPETILHIGDNKNSDYKQALKHGLKAYQYAKVSDKYLKQDIKFRKLSKYLKGFLDVSILVSLVSQKCDEDDYWVNFGYKYAGPFAYAYARHIYDIARKQQIKRILFIARDGYLIEKVFNTFNSDIKTSYVYAPRVLNYTANLDYNSDEQAKIICDYFGKDTGVISSEVYIEQNIKDFKQLAKEEKERTGYSQYIKQIAGKDKVLGTVDTISNQLSGQRLIEKESGVKTFGFYILTDPKQKKLEKFAYNNYFALQMKDSFTSDFKCDLTELIFSAPESPIITLRNGKPVYKQDIASSEIIRQDICKKIIKGAMNFAKDVKSRFNGEDIYLTPYSILTLLNIYVKKPEKKDIQAMLNVSRSPLADNSIYVPLLATSTPFWKVNKTKKLVWQTPLQRIGLIFLKPVKFRISKSKKIELVLFPYLKNEIFSLSVLKTFYLKMGAQKQWKK